MEAMFTKALEILQGIRAELAIPLATEKMEGPTTCIEFLGITLDSVRLEARLPQVKLQDLYGSLAEWEARQTCNKQQLKSPIGTLSYASKSVPAGRTFLRRIIRRQHHSRRKSVRTSTGGRPSLLPGTALASCCTPIGPQLPTSNSSRTARAPLASEPSGMDYGSRPGRHEQFTGPDVHTYNCISLVPMQTTTEKGWSGIIAILELFSRLYSSGGQLSPVVC